MTASSNTSKKKMSILEMAHIFGAELMGTAILMFAGCSTAPNSMMWTFAISAMVAIHTVGPISGAHLNPGATIVSLIMGKLYYKFAPIYWAAQFIGAFVGYILHYEIVLIGDNNSTCITKPPAIATEIRVLGVEIIMSFIFFIALAALWDSKNKHSSDTASLKFGFILYGLILSVSKDYALSMNTARSLPPAIITADFEGHWIYWVGPNVGAILAGGLYRTFYSNRPYLDGDEDIE
ncbi:aquaporin-2-like [Atheta coriaria]|uniref:aquaporin-2-like n=1 Tax=Dalotia coriaria TaxID=877792 RepID=UPI0031F3F465